MINIVSQPTEIAFSANPITFQLQVVDPATEKPYRAKGARAELSINTIAANETISLTFGFLWEVATSLTFTAKASVANETDIPITDLAAVAAKIQAHHLVAPVLNIYYDDVNNILTAEAKQIQSGWAINLESTVAGTTTETFDYEVIDGNYITCKIFFEDQYKQNNWREIQALIFTLHSDGSDIYWNISDIINQECQASLKENPFTHYNLNEPVLTDNRRRYYVQFKEYNPQAPSSWLREPIRVAVIGGIPNQNWLTYDNWFDFPANELKRCWFTYQPPKRRIRLTDKQFLTWYNSIDEADKNIAISLQTVNAQGVDSEWIIQQDTVIVCQKYQCITFPVHPSALGIDGTKKAYRIKIVDANSEEVLSDVKTFIIDSLPRRNMRQLAYLNAFGCPEVVTCVGESAKSITAEFIDFKTVRSQHHGGAVVKSNSQLNTLEMAFTYRTGNVPPSVKEVLTEVAISPVLFDITSSQYLALKLKANKVNNEIIGASDEFFYSWEWVLIPSVELNAFASESILRSTPTLAEPNQDNAGFDLNPGIDNGTGGGTVPVLRYVKIDDLASDTLILDGISATTTEQRERMRFYRGNFEIFLDGDITIEAFDIIRFTIPFDHETFRAYY